MIDKKLIRSVCMGLLSYTPGYRKLQIAKKRRSMHSASNAMFCYTFWLGLLKYLNYENIKFEVNKIGELGTAGSLGVGLCALLTGTQEYYALEIEDLFNVQRNLKLLDDLVYLLRNKTPISQEFSRINIPIRDNFFPSELLQRNYEDSDYIHTLRRNIIELREDNNDHIKFVLNWHTKKLKKLDFVMSRAVMEHVNNPSDVYTGIHALLKNSGVMLHDIELHSHGITKSQFGHRGINPWIWRIIQGNKAYNLNKLTHDMHIELIEKKFVIATSQKSLTQYENKHKKNLEPIGTVIVAVKSH